MTFIDNNGYVRRSAPGVSKSKYIYVHREVMEKHLKRKLYFWEIIHHINGKRDDNRIKNLQVLPRGQHNMRIQEIYKENQFLKSLVSEFLSIRT